MRISYYLMASRSPGVILGNPVAVPACQAQGPLLAATDAADMCAKKGSMTTTAA
jgi:hypothetical protein